MVCRILPENTILLSSRFQGRSGPLRPLRYFFTTPVAFWSLQVQFFMKIDQIRSLVFWFRCFLLYFESIWANHWFRNRLNTKEWHLVHKQRSQRTNHRKRATIALPCYTIGWKFNVNSLSFFHNSRYNCMIFSQFFCSFHRFSASICSWYSHLLITLSPRIIMGVQSCPARYVANKNFQNGSVSRVTHHCFRYFLRMSKQQFYHQLELYSRLERSTLLR